MSELLADPLGLLLKHSTWVLPVLLAITFHEASHGWMALKFGDDTAKRMGRLTFNPLRHIDPFGTVLLPLLFYVGFGVPFGYAKPVPVNFARLYQPKRDMVWVAAAGPGTNVLLALASGVLLHFTGLLPEAAEKWADNMLLFSVLINVVMALFNMIPLPPLDGGRVAVGLLPMSLAIQLQRTERYGLFVLIGLVVLLPMIGREMGMDLNVIWMGLEPLVDWLASLILRATGNWDLAG